MKIAQIAPLIESVPPRLYGGTERIVSYLTEELVAQGHDVTLFASGDSATSARLVPCCEQALRLNLAVRDPIPYCMIMLDKLRAMAPQFDILHFHIDQFHFPIFHDRPLNTLTTMHGRQDLADLKVLYEAFSEMPLVSISDAQREAIPNANFAGTVLHGIPRDLFAPTLLPRGGYLAFLGRISPEKRLDRAISIARAVGLPLKIAAKVDRADEAYFQREIVPLLDRPGIDFIGEVDEQQKGTFLGEAHALLFPIDWPEPFGLVMIEAMACGTPVLAFRHGSVPEVVDEGVTGHTVDGVEEAIRTIGRVLALDRGRVRRRFEQRFTAPRMVQDYVKIYEKLIGTRLRSGADRAHPIAVANGRPRIVSRSDSIRATRSAAHLERRRQPFPIEASRHAANLRASSAAKRSPTMRVPQPIDGAAFGPDALKAIGEAFDAAWAEIAANFGSDPANMDNARFKLATALLAVACEDSRDVNVLKTAALQRMALDYRDLP